MTMYLQLAQPGQQHPALCVRPRCCNDSHVFPVVKFLSLSPAKISRCPLDMMIPKSTSVVHMLLGDLPVPADQEVDLA